MPSSAPARDFLLPRLTALINETEAAGFARDVAVAVLIDLVTSPAFDTAAPDPKADSEPHNLWKRDQDSIVVAPGSPNVAPAIDAHDEADFVKPIGWFEPS